MKTYRVVKDNYAGFEAQVRYNWFPFIWFQASHYHWINTWRTKEQALEFIHATKNGLRKNHIEADECSEYEMERETKLLVFKIKNFSPEVVWADERQTETDKRKWWPVINILNG